MTAKEIKRQFGYVEIDFSAYCGVCRNCRRRGSHLRCLKLGIEVKALSICRAFESRDLPLNAADHPLFVNDKTKLLTYTQEAADDKA